MKILKVSDKFVLKQDDKNPYVFWVFRDDIPHLAINNRQIFFYCSQIDTVPVDLIADCLALDTAPHKTSNALDTQTST